VPYFSGFFRVKNDGARDIKLRKEREETGFAGCKRLKDGRSCRLKGRKTIGLAGEKKGRRQVCQA
jgi:hypothetical protein